jgi:HEAT repeat protein
VTRNPEPGTRNCCSAVPLRTWRPMVLWSAGVLLVLGLAWFLMAVVVPVCRVHAAAERIANLREAPFVDSLQQLALEAEEVQKLGGSERAARRIVLYLRLTRGSTRRHPEAVWMLRQCNPAATDHLIGLLRDSDSKVRCIAAECLGDSRAREAVKPLMALVHDADEGVRHATVKALGQIGDSEAVPALEAALKDESWLIGQTAAEALKMIRGGETLQ